MITEKQVFKAYMTLRQYCSDIHQCNDCVFMDSGTCLLEDKDGFPPYMWDLSDRLIEPAKESITGKK